MTPETSEKTVIKQWLTLNKFFWFWNLQGLGSFPGVPDITAIKDGRVIQIEVKAPKGHQSPRQRDFQKKWESAGGVYVCGTAKEIINFLCEHPEKNLKKI